MEKELMETSIRQFCTFRIDGRLYGIDILDVKEICPETGFTPIFHAPQAVKGYMNVRGRIYLLLDFRRILGFGDKTVDEASRVVLFKPGVGENFGILVDNIADIETVDGAQIENRRKQDQELPDGSERRGSDIALGICKLERELLVIINPRNLLGIIAVQKSRPE